MMMTELKTARLFHRIAQRVAPPPKLTVSQWADAHRRLSSEASAEPGQWRTDRAPYQREIMDAVNDPQIETIIIMSSAQVGKSEILNNIIGYHIDYDPAPIMMVQPTDKLSEAYSKDRIAPMIRDTPALQGKVKDVKSRDSGNTLLHKKFPGGHLTLSGANAPSSLASRPIRIVLCDEVDRYPASAGTEGDPVKLVSKRTTTFWNRKIVLVSTPTVKGVSRIEAAYEDSTMEQWCLPCPSCDEYQPFAWGQIKFEREDDEVVSVGHACRYCGSLHGEHEWKAGPGQWIARRKSVKVRGFHLNELASPWKSWMAIVEDFLEAKRNGTEQLKTWVNTSLGESWEEEGEQIEEEQLMKRREQYEVEVPAKVSVLTAAVDVQDDRLEVEVVGWGPERESWGVEYRRFYGDPGAPDLWDELDQYLEKEFSHESGGKIRISCACIDSGGHFTTEVYRFCRTREHRRIFAIKGKGGDVAFIGRMSRTPRERAALFIIGVDVGKERIMSWLKRDFEGPGYCHFPREAERGYDEDYFRGITSEKRVIRYHKGRPRIEWVKRSSVRNEPLDLRNYAYAALEILKPNLDKPFQGDRPVQMNTTAPKRRVISKGL